MLDPRTVVLKEDLLAMKDTARSSGSLLYKSPVWVGLLCHHMDCLFVLPVFHLLQWALACSDAGARSTRLTTAWIALVGITFVTCVLQLSWVELGVTRGMRARAV